MATRKKDFYAGEKSKNKAGKGAKKEGWEM